jgi:hypothetical protein
MQSIITAKNVNGFEFGVRSAEVGVKKKCWKELYQQMANGRWQQSRIQFRNRGFRIKSGMTIEVSGR